MANINDYLDWRGDIPISEEFGINEIDNMIFARISYLLFFISIIFKRFLLTLSCNFF